MEGKIFIQGDYYVRKTFYPPTEEKREAVELEFEEIMESYDNGLMDIFEFYEQISSDYNQLCLYRGLDYSDSECIYQLVIRGGRFWLVNLSRPDLKESFVVTPDVLDNDFLSLREFISKAEFIGEKGYVENPTFYDIYGMDCFNQCIVLYHGDDGVLVILHDDILFLDRRYTEVDWVYEGEKVKKPNEKYMKQLILQLNNNIQDYINFESDN